jgi:hypothetical protein
MVSSKVKRLHHKMLIVIVGLLLAACEDVPYMHVQGASRPRFVFHGANVFSLLVYRIPPKYINESIPLEVLQRV